MTPWLVDAFKCCTLQYLLQRVQIRMNDIIARVGCGFWK